MPLVVRAAAATFGITPPGDWDAFARSVRDLCARAGEAGVQLLVLPEYLSLGLEFPQRDATFDRRTAVDVPGLIAGEAKRHGMWILGGTHRVRDGQLVRNVALLCGPDGQRFDQAKVQRIPGEREPPDLVEPGTGLAVVETPRGRLAVQICYDVEFPEQARALALNGAEILLVPSWTETVAGFWRVRHCAHARAVENQVFVLHAPLVGSLRPFGIDETAVGSAAVIGPCDPRISTNGILAESPMSAAGHLAIHDLDLAALREIRKAGAVRTLSDYLHAPRWAVSTVSAATSASTS